MLSYERYHERIWPEIEASIRTAGITGMDIYRTGNRLFMIMETDQTFSFACKADMDAANPVVQEWEALMWQYQQALPGNASSGEATPGSEPDEKWRLMERVFALQESTCTGVFTGTRTSSHALTSPR